MDRTAVRLNHRVNSKLSLRILMDQQECQTVQLLVDKIGKSETLRIVYQEEDDFDKLMVDYTDFSLKGKSPFFEWGYLVSPEFVLCIGEHISFCHLDEDTHIFPWKYIDRGIYLADSWWFDDDEIVNDAISLSTIDFLMKYW